MKTNPEHEKKREEFDKACEPAATKAITIKNIDPELFRKFKVACAQNEIDMRKAILDFMTEYPI